MPLHFSHCDPGGKYHLFLSHTWLSGQDQALHRGPAAAAQHAGPSTHLLPPLPRQVHLIKRRLTTLAPSMSIFLDVDNLHAPLSVAARHAYPMLRT